MTAETPTPETNDHAFPTNAPGRARYHHGGLRVALIEAVHAQVAHGGVDGMSLAEACKSLGVSTAAPYRHFKDRDEILAEVTARGFSDMTRGFEHAVALEGEGTARAITAMGQAYVRFAADNPGIFRLMFGQAPKVTKAEVSESAGSDCFGYLIRQVALYCEAQGRADDVYGISTSLWTFVHGTSSLLIDGKYELVTPGLDVDAMIARATVGLLGTPSA